MDDLVSRQDVIDALMNDADWADAIPTIKSLPSSEPTTKCIAQIRIDRDDLQDLVNEKVNEIVETMSEPKTGRWIRKEKEINDCDGHRAYYWYECDNCGARPPKDQWGQEWNSDFCPNCGADMRGEQDE